jgi:hypothetical protein
MTCDHYWRDGIMLVEHGEPDPHRDTCVVCRREHRVREELIRALPLVGASADDDPHWETRVWSRIARLPRPRPRTRWRLGTGLAAAFAVAVMWWTLGRPERPADTLPRIAIVPGEIARRSVSPSVGDRVRITVGPADEVRVYRADQLVLRCPVASAGAGCTSGARGMVAETVLASPGDYQLVVVTSGTAAPVGRLDRDLWAIVSAGAEYQLTELSVR